MSRLCLLAMCFPTLDVGPCTMKLILPDSARKYAKRGATVISMRDGNDRTLTEGGNIKTDPAFADAPPAFGRQTRAVWKKFQQRLRSDY